MGEKKRFLRFMYDVTNFVGIVTTFAITRYFEYFTKHVSLRNAIIFDCLNRIRRNTNL